MSAIEIMLTVSATSFAIFVLSRIFKNGELIEEDVDKYVESVKEVSKKNIPIVSEKVIEFFVGGIYFIYFKEKNLFTQIDNDIYEPLEEFKERLIKAKAIKDKEFTEIEGFEFPLTNDDFKALDDIINFILDGKH